MSALSRRGDKFDILIDIGAYKGEFTESFTKIFSLERVILFEAQKDKFVRLRSKYPEFEIFNEVLSNTQKEVVFYNYESGSSYKKEIGQPDNVPEERRITRTIDDCINTSTLTDKKIFLKIDTQGSELEILANQQDLLSLVDMIQCEISVDKYNENTPQQSEYIKFFYSHNFVIADVVYAYRDKNGSTIQMDMIFKKV